MTDEERDHGGPAAPTAQDDDSQLNVTVLIEPAADDPEVPELAQVAIYDGNHRVRAALDYRILDEQGGLWPIGFAVRHLVADRPQDTDVRLGPGTIKDLPLARWDRVAQAAINTTLMHRSLAAVSRPLGDAQAVGHAGGSRSEPIATPLHVTGDRHQRAVEMVRRVKPELDPSESRGAARSWNGLVRLAAAADEYMELLAQGTDDVVGEMANRHGVAPATVRTWLFRARQASLTPTAWMEAPRALEPNDRPLTPEEAGGGRVHPGENPKTIGGKLAKARIDAGMTTNEAAVVSGLQPGTIHAIEQDDWAKAGIERNAIRDRLRMLARAVGLDPRPLLDQYDRTLPPVLTKPPVRDRAYYEEAGRLHLEREASGQRAAQERVAKLRQEARGNGS